MEQTCELPRWQRLKAVLNNLPPKLFLEEFRNTDGAVLVDVRTSGEVAEDLLDGAIHLDYLHKDFLDELDQYDRNRPYFIYCRTGRRSVRAGVLMKNWGFKTVFNMDGGLAALGQG